jgi:hypothetical protein
MTPIPVNIKKLFLTARPTGYSYFYSVDVFYFKLLFDENWRKKDVLVNPLPWVGCVSTVYHTFFVDLWSSGVKFKDE